MINSQRQPGIFLVTGISQEMAKSGGVNAALDNSKAIAKQIRILENRLDKVGHLVVFP